MQSILYREAVSRPDIEFAVNRAREFLVHFDEHHWQAVTEIMRYIKGTLNYCVVYGTSGSEHELNG